MTLLRKRGFADVIKDQAKGCCGLLAAIRNWDSYYLVIGSAVCGWGKKKKGPVNIKEAGTSDPRASSDLASLHFTGQITKAQEIIYLLH